MTKKLLWGSALRAELARAKMANNAVRQTLKKVLEEKPGPLLMSHYISVAALALGENLEALVNMEKIIAEAKNGETKEESENSK